MDIQERLHKKKILLNEKKIELLQNDDNFKSLYAELISEKKHCVKDAPVFSPKFLKKTVNEQNNTRKYGKIKKGLTVYSFLDGKGIISAVNRDILSNKIDIKLSFGDKTYSVSPDMIIRDFYIEGDRNNIFLCKTCRTNFTNIKDGECAACQNKTLYNQYKQKYGDIKKVNELRNKLYELINVAYKNDGRYVSHCWHCGKDIDSRLDDKCDECGWYRCSFCGACNPNCFRSTFGIE